MTLRSRPGLVGLKVATRSWRRDLDWVRARAERSRPRF